MQLKDTSCLLWCNKAVTGLDKSVENCYCNWYGETKLVLGSTNLLKVIIVRNCNWSSKCDFYVVILFIMFHICLFNDREYYKVLWQASFGLHHLISCGVVWCLLSFKVWHNNKLYTYLIIYNVIFRQSVNLLRMSKQTDPTLVKAF